jgi:hypothetical protein
VSFVTERSADVATVVVAVPLSSPEFPSAAAEVAVAVFVRTVPAVTDGSTATTRVKSTPGLVTAKEGLEQETFPVAPTAGVVQDQPPGDESETNVVPDGRTSSNNAETAASGPLFVTVIV